MAKPHRTQSLTQKEAHRAKVLHETVTHVGLRACADSADLLLKGVVVAAAARAVTVLLLLHHPRIHLRGLRGCVSALHSETRLRPTLCCTPQHESLSHI